MRPASELLDYDEVIARYEPVLGMEVHVELSTATKMFCGCATAFGAEPNTQVCPVCLGLPGSLPVLNEAAVESAIRIGLALNCEIVPWGRFARKNYFYPDSRRTIRSAVRRADRHQRLPGRAAGGRQHLARRDRTRPHGGGHRQADPPGQRDRPHPGATTSLIDYNRAGVPLIEIVTKPIEGTGERAPEIARAYVTALRDLLRALGVSDVRMDQGSMRCDSNVSLKPIGATEFGTRTETKNVNSLQKRRGRGALRDAAAGRCSGVRRTRSSRRPGTFTRTATPARAAPRRPPRTIATSPNPTWSRSRPAAELVERLRQTIPELPWLRRKRIQQDWGVSDEVMRDLVNAGAVDLVIATVEQGASSDQARAWWGNFLVQKANEAGVELDELAITPAQVAAVVALVDEGKLTNKLARQVVEGVLAGEGEPEQVMTARGLAVVRDDSLIQAAVDEALAANPDVAEKIRGGKVQAAGAIVGAVMKATKGQADAARVRELVLEACS